MTYTENKLVTIAVGNIITGVYNYIVLSLPHDWRIIVIPMNSDVFSGVRQGNVKWVREGEVEHGIATPIGEIMLRLRIWPGYKDHRELKETRGAEKYMKLPFQGTMPRHISIKGDTGLRFIERWVSTYTAALLIELC
jgi:hypothetical protein